MDSCFTHIYKLIIQLNINVWIVYKIQAYPMVIWKNSGYLEYKHQSFYGENLRALEYKYAIISRGLDFNRDLTHKMLV